MDVGREICGGKWGKRRAKSRISPATGSRKRGIGGIRVQNRMLKGKNPTNFLMFPIEIRPIPRFFLCTTDK
jgi:hypothetical protein